jgi:hypothetical protein
MAIEGSRECREDEESTLTDGCWCNASNRSCPATSEGRLDEASNWRRGEAADPVE